MSSFDDAEQRIEGRLKVTGGACYTADIRLPGMLESRFLVSPHPAARIRAIDTTAALAVPGVHAVLTGDNVAGARFGRFLLDQPVLAYGRVRHVGERVAVVAAETRAAAESAVDAIEVDYEPLPALLDSEAALSPGAPLVHERSDYAALIGVRRPQEHPNIQGRHIVERGGDVEAALAAADRIFTHTFRTPRQHQGYIEPHACIVWIDEGVVRVLSTTKSPFSLRQQLAACTGLAPDSIVVQTGFIGGDFGGKGYSVDEFACYFLAVATQRPVRSVMTYVEELEATSPRHASVIRVRTGVDVDGRFVAHDARVLFDGGAYASGKPVPSLVPPGGVATMSAYRVPVARFDVTAVYTNAMPSGHMRSPGEMQALFAGESHIDMIAAELGLDPFELRARNVLRSGDQSAAGERLRDPKALEVLDALRHESRWGAVEIPSNRGRGIALWQRRVGLGRASALLRLGADGRVEIVTAAADQGGGTHTALRRIAASVLDLSEDRVSVTAGSTADVPFDSGVGDSRVTYVLGEAVRRGAEELRARFDEPRPIEALGTFEADHDSSDPVDCSFVALMVEVDVDRRTGKIGLRDAILVADIGTIINPLAHQGQLEGGFVFGLGGALMEELVIDDGRVVTLTLGDYKLPTAADVPPLRTVLVRSSTALGPFGAKAVGELSNSGVAPAIANAVADAVGVRVQRLPITAESIWESLVTESVGKDRAQ